MSTETVTAILAVASLPEPIVSALKALQKAAYRHGWVSGGDGDALDSAAEFRQATRVIAQALAPAPAGGGAAGSVLRLCGYCKTWNAKPCGVQCCLNSTDSTWDALSIASAVGADRVVVPDGMTPALWAAVNAWDAERCRLNEMWHGGRCEPCSDAAKINTAPMLLPAIAAYNATLAATPVAPPQAAPTSARDRAAFGASEASAYYAPGAGQESLRRAFEDGAAFAQTGRLPQAAPAEAPGLAEVERLALALIGERTVARAEGRWAASDRIRDVLSGAGFTLTDHKDGTTTWASAATRDEGGAGAVVPVRWRHVKRGTTYEEIGRAKAQASTNDGFIEQGDDVVIYRGQDGALWIREVREFHDGRFVRIADAAARTEG